MGDEPWHPSISIHPYPNYSPICSRNRDFCNSGGHSNNPSTLNYSKMERGREICLIYFVINPPRRRPFGGGSVYRNGDWDLRPISRSEEYFQSIMQPFRVPSVNLHKNVPRQTPSNTSTANSEDNALYHACQREQRQLCCY